MKRRESNELSTHTATQKKMKGADTLHLRIMALGIFGYR